MSRAKPGANNPGNAQDPAPPFVPLVIGCNRAAL